VREMATVVALEDDGAWVETQRQSTCGACSARAGCGQGVLNQLLPGRQHYLRALVDPADRAHLVVGDRVALIMADDVVLSASAVLYLVPLAALLLGALLGDYLLPGDAGAVAGGVLGLALGALLVRLHAGSVRHDPRMQPRLERLRGQRALATGETGEPLRSWSES